MVKLVTFCASNLTNSVKGYNPLWIFTAVKADWSVAIINFSASVICFATTLLILVCRNLVISSTVSPYRNASKVKESTHANRLVLGILVAVRMSPYV